MGQSFAQASATLRDHVQAGRTPRPTSPSSTTTRRPARHASTTSRVSRSDAAATAAASAWVAGGRRRVLTRPGTGALAMTATVTRTGSRRPVMASARRTPPAPSRATWRPPTCSTVQEENPASAASPATSSAPTQAHSNHGPSPSRGSAAGPRRRTSEPGGSTSTTASPPEPAARAGGAAAGPGRRRCRCCRRAAARCPSGPRRGAGRTPSAPARSRRPLTRSARARGRDVDAQGRNAPSAERRGDATGPAPDVEHGGTERLSTSRSSGWRAGPRRRRPARGARRSRHVPSRSRGPPVAGVARARRRRPAPPPPRRPGPRRPGGSGHGSGRMLGLSARAPHRRTIGHVTATTTATTTSPVRTGTRHAAGTDRVSSHPTPSTTGSTTRSWTSAAPTTQVTHEPMAAPPHAAHRPRRTHDDPAGTDEHPGERSGPRGASPGAGGVERPPVPLT